MKALNSKLVLISISLIFIGSCSPKNITMDEHSFDLTDEIATDLVSDFNSRLIGEYGIATPQINKGFWSVGKLTSSLETDEYSRDHLSLLFENPTAT